MASLGQQLRDLADEVDTVVDALAEQDNEVEALKDEIRDLQSEIDNLTAPLDEGNR